VDIGLGMKPDLTGKGLGLNFLEMGLQFARQHFAVRSFRLAVATFNQRAIKLYVRAGFQPTRVYKNYTNGGEFDFLEMTREA
jgi:[ribosomal protein S18]-alanine N-acetyltransferase